MTANREAGEAEDPDARIWLIIKEGYYYRANRSGYTKDIPAAGRYTRAEADREAAIEPWHMSVEREPEPSPDAVANREADDARVWRHKKRGTVYTEICRGELQIATTPPVEGDTLIAYRGDDGRTWFRLDREFEDGRFEPVATVATHLTRCHDALRAAREVIDTDRTSVIELWPDDSDKIIAKYDATLAQIDEVLK